MVDNFIFSLQNPCFTKALDVKINCVMRSQIMLVIGRVNDSLTSLHTYDQGGRPALLWRDNLYTGLLHRDDYCGGTWHIDPKYELLIHISTLSTNLKGYGATSFHSVIRQYREMYQLTLACTPTVALPRARVLRSVRGFRQQRDSLLPVRCILTSPTCATTID